MGEAIPRLINQTQTKSSREAKGIKQEQVKNSKKW
jgi:hypothetical protein